MGRAALPPGLVPVLHKWLASQPFQVLHPSLLSSPTNLWSLVEIVSVQFTHWEFTFLYVNSVCLLQGEDTVWGPHLRRGSQLHLCDGWLSVNVNYLGLFYSWRSLFNLRDEDLCNHFFFYHCGCPHSYSRIWVPVQHYSVWWLSS